MAFSNITNRMGVPVSPQVSHLQDIPTGEFTIGRIFLIKNNTSDSVEATVEMADGGTVTTMFEPGWNPELVMSIIDAPNGLQSGY